MQVNNKFLHKTHLDDFCKQVEETSIIQKLGGPFGAFIFKDDKIVGVGFNNVISQNDPTAHAEIQAIRNACKHLNTYDLSGYEIYATGYPCPMCMSAIIWANIKKVHYSADYDDAKEIGFRDDFIYKFIKNGCKNTEVLEIESVDKTSIIELYNKYKSNKELVY